MNWKEINKKHPKAFDLFFRWFKGDPTADLKKETFLKVNNIEIVYGTLRELYDFFDEQEIYISVKRRYITLTKSYGFDADIFCYKHYGIAHFQSRREVEEAAFEKAFEILEKNKIKTMEPEVLLQKIDRMRSKYRGQKIKSKEDNLYIKESCELIEKFKRDLLIDFLEWAINNDYIEFDRLLSVPEDVNVTMDIAEKLIKEYFENNKK